MTSEETADTNRERAGENVMLRMMKACCGRLAAKQNRDV
jgi:hypothetical protein